MNSASFAKVCPKRSFHFFLLYTLCSGFSLESEFAFLVILAFLVNRCHIAFIIICRLALTRDVVTRGARETCLMRYEFILSFEADHLDFTLGFFIAGDESLSEVVDVAVKHVCEVAQVLYIITFLIISLLLYHR